MKRLKTTDEKFTHLTYTGFDIYESIKRVSRRRRVVYYNSRKRELEIRLMNESRCDERLKARVQEAT